MTTPQTHVRFTRGRRVEHALLILSFTTLAVTGLPQKFAGAAWAEAVIGLFGGIETTRVVHRTAATLLMLETVYHLAAVAYQVWVRRVRMSMLPTLQDVRDAWQAFRFNLGLAKLHPQLGRYTFEEKAEYWALIWGTVVMIITGFMLWNPIATARFFPGQFIPAAKAAHGGEALLAVLAVIVWHMYHVHLRTFNKSMWTGTLTEEEMRHEHPLEMADLKAGLGTRPVDPATLRQRRRVFFPVVGVAAAALLVGLYGFVTFEQTAIATLPDRQNVEVFAPQTPTPLPPTPTAPPVGDVTWNGYISSVFAQKCAACHGQAAKLSLEAYASALQGSQNGPVIRPGDAANSRLVMVQAAGGHPGQLSADELARVKEWIDLGALEH